MDRRESSVPDQSARRPSNLSALQTPHKPTREDEFKKPETFNVAHVTDSLDRARLAGMTYSARTIHPQRRHTESACPTPVISNE